MHAKINHSPDFQVRLLDDLVKVFVDEAPVPSQAEPCFSVLRNDRLSFQLACLPDGAAMDPALRGRTRLVQVSADFPLAEGITLRAVRSVPCLFPALSHADDLYLRKGPGLYPDLLEPLSEGFLSLPCDLWTTLWVDVEVSAGCAPGAYPLRITLTDFSSGEELISLSLEITVLPFVLPVPDFPRTEWFHADCLADFYRVPVFSEEHWALLRTYIAAAVRRGVNMILTPHFTPPLDTAVGRERPTVQLVKVRRDGGVYSFDFTDLRRWIQMCLDCGIRYFEMSHLFSQWGAVAAPKIMGEEDGVPRRLFGWNTPAVGGEYTTFLQAYLPRLREVLASFGLEDRTWFHLSDEPSLQQLESYRAARDSVRELLQGCRVMDAISDYAFYESGLIDYPVCATNHISPFLDHKTPGLWSYYCIAQSQEVSNCFIAQPSGRTRLYGAQMYKAGIMGSLRWGFNFYNSVDSCYHINPYLITDGDCFFPAGDAFIVYPGLDGQPLESIRMMVLDDTFRDLCALQCLEKKIGRERTLALLEEGLPEPLTFTTCLKHPADAAWVLAMRQRINAALCE